MKDHSMNDTTIGVGQTTTIEVGSAITARCYKSRAGHARRYNTKSAIRLLQLLQNLLKKRLELFVHLQSPVSSSSEINRPRAAPPKHSVRGCNNLRPTISAQCASRHLLC
jgi:hypothetical protein